MTAGRLEVVKADGFESWACYLINGDDSGLDPGERQAADKFAEYMGGSIVSTEGDSFFGSCATSSLRGQVVTYCALVAAEPS